MAQFDVYPGIGRVKGYVVALQADLMEGLPSRIVAPLVPKDTITPISRLTPTIRFQGSDYLLLTYQLASVPARELQRPVGSLADDQDAIKQSLDMLFIGF
jgi:toxin CcdB